MSAWTLKARRPSRGVSQTRKLKRDFWRRSLNKKEGCCGLLRRWVWTPFTAGLFFIALSRVGEADTLNPVCATAKLCDTQIDEIRQWSTNLTNESVKELTPLFAQVGACRQRFCEEFERESFPYRSSVSQDIYETNRHAGIPSLLVSPEPAVRIPHTQPHGDDLSLFHDGGQNSSIGCGQPQMNVHDMCGWERSNPFCHHTARRGRKYTGRKCKLEISDGANNILQCNVTNWSEHARHFIITSDFDAALISTVNNGTSAGVVASCAIGSTPTPCPFVQTKTVYSVLSHHRRSVGSELLSLLTWAARAT